MLFRSRSSANTIRPSTSCTWENACHPPGSHSRFCPTLLTCAFRFGLLEIPRILAFPPFRATDGPHDAGWPPGEFRESRPHFYGIGVSCQLATIRPITVARPTSRSLPRKGSSLQVGDDPLKDERVRPNLINKKRRNCFEGGAGGVRLEEWFFKNEN